MGTVTGFYSGGCPEPIYGFVLGVDLVFFDKFCFGCWSL